MKQPTTPTEIDVAGALAVRCFTSDGRLPDEDTRRQLERLAAVPGLRERITVLPDVHCKRRYPSPTGTVVVSDEVLVPRAVDTGINGGILALSLPIVADDLSPKVLDDLFGGLMRAIPHRLRDRSLLSDEECEAGVLHGLEWLADRFELTPTDLARVENGGRAAATPDADAIRACLTPKALRKAVSKGNASIGTVGAGNHFLELQAVDAVLDAESARSLGLAEGQALFMLHTDARRLGKKLLDLARKEAESLYRDATTGELWTVPLASEIGERYVCALATAIHAGFLNRAAVVQIVRREVRRVLGDACPPMPIVYDCSHETIQRETHGDKELWVHRHGASRALPASELAHDPVLGKLGQPIPIPGSMGTCSYVAVAGSGVAATFHSAAHGAGRVLDKDLAKEAFDGSVVEGELAKRGIRLYRYGVDDIAGQAPASFKDVDDVITTMERFDLVRPVARLRPVAVLKG